MSKYYISMYYKRRKSQWIGHNLLSNCLPKHVTEGKTRGSIEVTVGRERGRKQLLDDLMENGRYWKLKGETLDLSLWRNGFARVYGPVVSQTAS
jgi:hypothetical protein